MNQSIIARALATATLAAGLLTACGGLPPLQRVTLSPPQTQRAGAEPSDWQVRRVQVPEYLDNYDIQLRSQSHILDRLPNARWAERLPVAMTRLLQETIDEKLVNNRDKNYEVHVTVDTFEPQPSGKVVLSAEWRVTDANERLVARDTTLITEPLPMLHTHAPDVVGQAMSEAVRELAMQIMARAG